MGDWDAALKRFMQKIAPAPIFTKFITNLFSDTDFVSPVSDTDLGGKIKKTFKKGGRVGYNEGDMVVPIAKPNNTIEGYTVTNDDNINKEDENNNNLNTPLKEKTIDGEIPMKFNDESIQKGKEISMIIENKLNERGIKNSKNIADGITGNIYAENSKFISNQEEVGDINKLKDKQKGYGLFQFTDYKNKKGELVGHRTEYKKYLINNNKKDNAESQVEYVLDNIFTKGKGSGFDIGAGNKEMLRLTFSSGNASNIADVFMQLYERPESDSSLKKRVDFAKSLFNKREK